MVLSPQATTKQKDKHTATKEEKNRAHDLQRRQTQTEKKTQSKQKPEDDTQE